MQMRELGKSGIKVTPMAYGGWPCGGGGEWGKKLPDETYLAAIRAALEGGINFLDSAVFYGHGHSEELIGQAIKGYDREKIVLSTKQVAQSCGISESTAYHVLRKELNKTPNQLRQEAKCQQAVRLLSCTALPVEEISTQLGFSSSSYMRKLLRATTGKTPLQLRKAAQFI